MVMGSLDGLMRCRTLEQRPGQLFKRGKLGACAVLTIVRPSRITTKRADADQLFEFAGFRQSRRNRLGHASPGLPVAELESQLDADDEPVGVVVVIPHVFG